MSENEEAVGGGGKSKDKVAATDPFGSSQEEPIVAYTVGTAVSAELVNESKDSKKITRKWVHGFCDICYVDKESNNKCFPYCFPYATPCSCIMLGMLVTKYSRERPVCCEMDGQGVLCCLLSSVASYFTLDLYCVIHAMFYRADVIYKYNVDTEKEVVCCQCFDVIYRGCCFPCSYYQMYNSMKLWDAEDGVAFVDTGKNV